MQDNQLYSKANRLVSEARLELERLHRLIKVSAVLLQLSRESIRESTMMLILIEPRKHSLIGLMLNRRGELV
jgi:hypothetical protein